MAELAVSRKIRTLIVDDEPLARSNLSILLAKDEHIELIGDCESATEAVAMISATRPDLIFLDVQMPERDGFDVLELLGPNLPAAIVFVTAYDEYALRAFDAGALDYLLKPFDDARFQLALERAKQRLALELTAIKQPERIAIKCAHGIEFVKVAEIDWIEAADYYVCLHIGRRTQLLRRSLTTLARELDAESFTRIHRSVIVNNQRVRAVKLSDNGEYEVVIDDGTALPLSRRYRKAVLARWS